MPTQIESHHNQDVLSISSVTSPLFSYHVQIMVPLKQQRKRSLVAATMALLISSMASPSTCFSSPKIPSGSRTSSTSASSILLRATTTEKTNPSSQTSSDLPDDVKIVSCMPDPLPSSLRHDYYLLRHGQSTANVASIISSARRNAYSERHGLTPVGYEQGAAAATALVEALERNGSVKKGDKVMFVASPFARAKQTAEACLAELLQNQELQNRLEALGLTLAQDNIEDIILKDKLMERYFGKLDNEAIYTYAYVWPVDKFNVTHTAFNVESVAAVCTRIRELIVDDLEQSLNDGGDQKYHVVLTSHADVLQITQLYAAGAENVGAFSSYRFGNGEVRAMVRTPDSLPEPAPLEAPKRGTQT